jgi:D-hydroxyproline dehydrogenase subunit beta
MDSLMQSATDAVVVGAGVLGLAHAYTLAKRGLKVVVCERHPRALGASVRNFGMIWPIGQPLGFAYELAQRSAQIWQGILNEAKIWHDPCGSVHLAYHEDEAQVLQEFEKLANAANCPCEFLPPEEVLKRFPAVNPQALRGALWSRTELAVDPREVIRKLPAWLNANYGVEFLFGTRVQGVADGLVSTNKGVLPTKYTFVCTGADFQELAPTQFANSGIVPCKLQMMRTQAYGDTFRLRSMFAAGLTLRHYKSFAACPTLPALAARLDREMAEYGRFGIHVLASQNSAGELTLGDTHEYGDDIEPFDKAHLDELVLKYLRGMLHIPDLTIVERWHGIYAKHPTQAFVSKMIAPKAFAVTAVGGAGMTLSFGLAEQMIDSILGD